MRKLKNWLEEYLKYVEDTESPDQYKFWCGLSAIGTVLKRKVYFQYGSYKIYPNIYIILVGPPGVGKGTAMNPAMSLVKESGAAHYLKDRMTAEKIVDTLAQGFLSTQTTPTGGLRPLQESCATITASEISILLGASDWMLPFLCELWDKNEFEYGTKNGGNHIIKNLCVGMLGGCTPDYIRKLNKDAFAAIASGFTSRTLFVFAAEKGKDIIWPKEPDPKLGADLIEDLKYFSQLQGGFIIEDKAKKLFEDFITNTKPLEFDSEIILNFKARLKSHIFKTAMCLSISTKDNLVINEAEMQLSINLVSEVLGNLDITFRSVGESPIAEAQNRVMNFLEKKGVCSRSEILKANYRHITDEDLTRILTVLKACGFISEQVVGSKMTYTWLKNQATIKPNIKVNAKGAGIP